MPAIILGKKQIIIFSWNFKFILHSFLIYASEEHLQQLFGPEQ
jgi:hypothetical protein